MVRTRAALAAAAIVAVAGPIALMIAQERDAETPPPAPQQADKPSARDAAKDAAKDAEKDAAKAAAERSQAEAERQRSLAEATQRTESSGGKQARATAEAPPVPALPPPPVPAAKAPAEPARPAIVESLARPAPQTRALSHPATPGVEQAYRPRSYESSDARPPAFDAVRDGSAEPIGRDRFDGKPQSGFKPVREAPVSTFSIDVDTASYGFVRASLNRDALPPPDAVRTEELVNYFPYGYEAPQGRDAPFRVTASVFPSPWAEGRKLVRIGIKGYEFRPESRPRANLVFLVDTSGSMGASKRLPLVKRSLALLMSTLDERDRVAIVAYAGQAGTVLEPTAASDRQKILSAIEGLGAGGSTAGGEGLRQAYALAERNFDPSAVNRVMLATDGDFNVGITNQDELKGFVERKRETGIFLSVLGFGMGNYNDALMQALAQNGNGTAATIDTLGEARKTLVEEATATLFPIAKDVKIQVEFNPAAVSEYRLIGYETRALNRDDFENDKVDAGEVGAGQSATALYEIVPVGGSRTMAPLRYGAADGGAKPEAAGPAGEYGYVKIRYKKPDEQASRLIETPVGPSAERKTFAEADEDARFATAVAGFGELLRGGRWTGKLTFDEVLKMASGARGEDAYGYRSEFLQLVRAAKTAQALQSSRR